MAYNIGDRAGDYEIVEVLGAGGMGRVYKVRNIISERVEAMKVLLPNLESDPDLADRFMREIKVQASLQHPNIAALHTAMRLNNQLLMLIEYVEGVTLEAELQKGRIAVDKAIDYIRQVLLALSYAHSHGVVHRDIKPANMMLMPNGSVKLMDFGIARLSADRRLTQTGRTVGSLYYMSPEQIQGALDLDARSDLYSLGVSFYELVTGKRPFLGDSDYSIMAAHLSSRPVPPIELDPTLPEMLNEVILMAIAKDPAQRFQTADAFRSALESVAAGLKTLPSSATKIAQTPRPQVSAQPVVAPVTPAAPPQSSGGSRRGLYMALGSVVTVLVLAFAAMQIPKFSGSHANTNPPANAPVNPPVAAVSEPPVTQPATQQPAAVAPPVQTASSSVPQPSSQPAPILSKPVKSEPVKNTQPGTPAPRETAVAVPAPAPQPPAQQPAVQQQAAPAPSGPSPAEIARQQALQAQRETLVQLESRTSTIRGTLTRMKQQQAAMGLSLRGDITSAESRLEYNLQDAAHHLKTGDAEKMKKAMDSAERALETIEKFLGH